MANGAFKFKDNSGNVVSFISGSGSNISFSGGTLDLSGMTGLTLGNLTLSGTTQNALSASHAASYLLTSSFNTYSGTTDTVIGTLQTSTSSLNSFTSSATTRLNSIETSTGSLNSYTSSNNTKLGVIESTTGSLNSYTSSNTTNVNAIHTSTGSLNTFTSSATTRLDNIETSTGSLNSFTSSATTRLNSIEGVSGSYATTGSNQFKNDQVITGSLTVTGFIDAQELRTTYISSSILYRSGSTKFGDELSDTHSFTGSLLVSGTISVPGSNLVSGSSQVLNGSGVFSGSAQLPSGIVSGSAQTIANLPSGTVSGSVQVDVMSTTNIARLATTGSNVFTGALTGTTFTGTGLVINNNGEVLRAYGTSPNVSFYNAANTTRGGYVNHDGSNMNIVANVGNIVLGSSATFSSAITGTTATFSDLIVTDTYANDPLIKLVTTTSGNVEVQMRTASTSYNAGIGIVTSGYDFSLFTNNTARFNIGSDGSIAMGNFSPSGTPTSDYRSFEIGRQGNTIAAAPWKSNLYLSTNATITAGSTAFTYRFSSVVASLLTLEGGAMAFSNASEGTAGNTISFTQRLILDSTGRLGVGYDTPAYQLQVLNTIGLRANSQNIQAIKGTGWGYSPSTYKVVMLGDTANNVTVSIGYDPSGNSNSAFNGGGGEVLFRNGASFATPTSANTAFHLNTLVLKDGNIGIGIAPTSWGSGATALQIGTAGSVWNRASDNLFVLSSNSYFNGSADIQITTGASNRIYFNAGQINFERAASTAAGAGTPWITSMVIPSTGGLVVGSSSKWEASVDVAFRATGATNWALNANSLNTGSPYLLLVTTGRNNSADLLINCETNHTALGGSATTARFQVNGGGVIYASNTTVQSISDIRTKENIIDAESGLNIINNIKVRRFDFKDGFGDNKKNQLGFIAQEIETVFPEAVGLIPKTSDSQDNDIQYKTVGPGALIPVLVKAIQEQQQIISDLKETLTRNNLS